MGLFESKTERAERLYQQGLRTKNRNGQEKLYLKAAELGNCDAMADLAFNYKCIWSRDNDKALVWYEKAAEHGSVGAILKLLEWYYFDGDCPYFDPQRGWDWVERSKSMTFPKHRAPWAEDLSRYYTPEGLYALALKHTGKGLGHYLLKAAAERGHSAAQARHDCLMNPPRGGRGPAGMRPALRRRSRGRGAGLCQGGGLVRGGDRAEEGRGAHRAGRPVPHRRARP